MHDDAAEQREARGLDGEGVAGLQADGREEDADVADLEPMGDLDVVDAECRTWWGHQVGPDLRVRRVTGKERGGWGEGNGRQPLWTPEHSPRQGKHEG